MINERIFQKIEKIYRQLLNNKFVLYPATGVPLPRPRKSPRPIVIAPISNRIVQRSILDVLQSEESVNNYVDNPFSYGGINNYDEPKGVHSAVQIARSRRQDSRHRDSP